MSEKAFRMTRGLLFIDGLGSRTHNENGHAYYRTNRKHN
ncbi:hypothetical protein NRS6153_14745 [Bacillus subtilis]|nr:hypothetical protein NRS6153_14745 [Bacillus subtilis]